MMLSYKEYQKYDKEFPIADEEVDGLKVREEVPNLSSIGASLNEYTILPSIREVSFDNFTDKGSVTDRIKNLATQLEVNKEINPLIVVVDKDGPYILEGSHRYDALLLLGKKKFPALVVIDED